ncbi:MAG TPA: phosphoribosyltransferase family protein [Nitrososphaerales archaeon]|nr:phosphoribosyltransferase family protein [Nitrososphaerales archaeon]
MTRALYLDRAESGRALAAAVRQGLHGELAPGKPLVLAIPRGGVPIGRDVASALDADLDLVVPRKLGAEGNPEYAIGAVMSDGTAYLNPEALSITMATPEYIEAEKGREMREAARRLEAYRGGRSDPSLSGRVVIVVDDGIATGATMVAALRWVRSRGARMVVAAAPVAPRNTVSELRQEADLVICPRTPEPFYAIGAFYENFGQVSDEEVKEILLEYWKRPARDAQAR